jgi:hypothetical protein
VIRPSGPHTAGVHALLDHLGSVGFDGAPRVIAVAHGRETLEYLPGEVPVPRDPPDSGAPVVSADALVSIALLLRRFHDAARDFTPPAEARWQGGAPSPFDGEHICHNDPVVGNIVFRHGLAVALIDFDYSGPSDPIWDVAIAAQHWIPLTDPSDLVELPPGWSPSERLILLARAYGLPDASLPRLLDAVDKYLDRGWWSVKNRVEAGEPAFVAYWEVGLGDRIQRARQWLRKQRSSLLP